MTVSGTHGTVHVNGQTFAATKWEVATPSRTPEQAFRDAIAANPLDATHRMAFADWLDEQDRPLDAALERVLGEPDSDAHRLAYADVCERVGQRERAEFIRVQCELAKMPDTHEWEGDEDALDTDRICPECGETCGVYGCGKVDCAELSTWRTKLRERERELLKAAQGWLPCGPFAPRGCVYAALNLACNFSRGFVNDVEGRAIDWIALAETILASHPVREVSLTTLPAVEYNPNGWEGYARLRDRQKIVSLGAFVNVRDAFTKLVVALCREEWPRVTFTLPLPTNYVTAQQQILADIAASLAVPAHLSNPPAGG